MKTNKVTGLCFVVDETLTVTKVGRDLMKTNCLASIVNGPPTSVSKVGGTSSTVTGLAFVVN